MLVVRRLRSRWVLGLERFGEETWMKRMMERMGKRRMMRLNGGGRIDRLVN